MTIRTSLTSTALAHVLVLALSIGGLSLTAGPVMAQDDDDGPPKASQRENVRYYNIIYVKFKAGHNDAAWNLLYEKFQPASEAAGNRFVVLDFESGRWTSAIYIPLPGGYVDLEYTLSPQGEKFWAALIEQEGSLEAARAAFGEWQGHIANSATAIAHMHLPEEDGDDAE